MAAAPCRRWGRWGGESGARRASRRGLRYRPGLQRKGRLEILAKPGGTILACGAREGKQMPLAQEDATRILRFCLAGDGTGTAFREDHLCVLKVVRSGVAAAEAFEGGTFEEALR